MSRARLAVVCALVAPMLAGMSARALATPVGPLPPVTAQIDAPAGAATDPVGLLAGVSCSPANGCLAVGSYAAASGRTFALLATPVNGSAPRAARGAMPAAAGAGASAELRAVSCAAFGNCLAVGDYTSSSGRTVGYVDAWNQGAQRTAVPPLRGDAAANPREVLSAVSCPASGGCVVVGAYATASAPTVPLVERLAPNGHWAAPVAVGVPAGAAAAPHAALSAASCWTTGGCVIAGAYTDATGAVRPYAVRLASSNPGSPAAVALPSDAAANPHATVGGASCPSATWCVVAGTYRTAAGQTEPYATTLGAGGSAQGIDPPSDAAANPLATGGAITCPAAGSCLLAAGYTDSTHAVASMTDQLDATGWNPATRVLAPATASGDLEQLAGASCTPVRRCTVVGSALDVAGHTQAVAGAAYLAPGPVTGLLVRQVAAGAVRLSWSAPAADGAGAAWYSATDADGAGPDLPAGQTAGRSLVVAGLLAGHRYRFAVTVHADDNQTSPSPTSVTATISVASAPRNVAASPRSLAVVVTWLPPATAYGAALTGYVVSVSWKGGSEKVTTGVTRSVRIPSLIAGRTYTFQVAATTAAGAGAQSAPVSCIPAA